MSERCLSKVSGFKDTKKDLDVDDYDIRTIEKLIQNLLNLLIKGLQKLDVEENTFDKFQNVFYSSDSLEEYLDGLYEMLKVLVSRIENEPKNRSSIKVSLDKNMSSLKTLEKQNENFSNENYENLEKILQKYEAEIREHIRIEQQLKIYSDGLEEKLLEKDNENQEKVDSLQKQINDLNTEKSHLSKLFYDLKFEKLYLEKKLKKNDERPYYHSKESNHNSIRKVFYLIQENKKHEINK